MKIIKSALIIIGVFAIVFVSINATQNDHSNDAPTANNQESQNKKRPVKDYNIYALPMPENINFAGEPAPIDDPDIYERMDRELLVNTYWQSNALLLIKRANKYFPLIETILKEEGVPDDFKYLAVIESGLTQAVSPAGARGVWQIMKGTGRDYGLEINENVDERYHIEKLTRVAANYLKKAKQKFGSWTLAAAAYNAGNRGIQRQLDRQKVDDYYELLLGQETGRYIFRILALKEILSHPKKYGFNFEEDQLYQPIQTRTVKVDTVVSDLADFAKSFDINYKILKIHNPWLREAHLNNASRREYEIKIPEKNTYTAVK